jgi:hypothetical protein
MHLDCVGMGYIPDMDGMIGMETADIDLELLGHILWETLDFDFVDRVFQDTTFPYTDGVTDKMHRNLGTDDNILFDLEKIHMVYFAPEPVKLAILDKAVKGVCTDMELYYGAFRNTDNGLGKILGSEGQGDRLAVAVVHDSRNPAVTAEAVEGTLGT